MEKAAGHGESDCAGQAPAAGSLQELEAGFAAPIAKRRAASRPQAVDRGPPPALGLAGVTVTSMALIGPGAFLWTTLPMNLAAADKDQTPFAKDTFTGIIFAAFVAFITAFPFAELAHVYPEAGAGGAYYFAQRAFRHSKIRALRPCAHAAKWYMGFSIHLFYWMYAGVATALTSQVVLNLANTSPWRSGTGPLAPFAADLIAIGCAAVVALVAVKGVEFGMVFNFCVVVMQSLAILMYGVLWICFRTSNQAGPPEMAAHPASVGTAGVPAGTPWLFESTAEIFTVHSGVGMVFQSSIAILLVVGFDSSTQLGAETKKPERNVAIGCVLSLAIQALVSYPFEYITALAALPASFQTAASAAPIADLTVIAGNHFGLNGYALMCIQGATVLLSIFGTTLGASNAAVRVSLFMATEKQLPSFMCRLHRTWRTPWVGILISFAVNAVLAVACVSGDSPAANAIVMTGITMASNVGTFLLYAGICFTCVVNFAGKPHFNWWRHGVVPVLGLFLNLMEVFVIYVVAFLAKDLPAPLNAPAVSGYIALGIVGGWLAAYVLLIWGGQRGLYGTKDKCEFADWSVRAQKRNVLPTYIAGHEVARPEDEWSFHDAGFDGAVSTKFMSVVADTNFAARRSIEVRRSLCLPRTSLCLPGASEHRGADTAGDAAAAGVHTRLSLDRHLDLVGGSLHARVLRFSIDRDRNSASASFTTGIRSSDGGGRCRSVQSSLASPGMSMDEIKVGEEAEGPAPAPAPAPAPGCVAAGCEPAAPVPAPAPAAVRVAEGVSPSSDRGDRDVNRELELAPRPAAVANAPADVPGPGHDPPPAAPAAAARAAGTAADEAPAASAAAGADGATASAAAAVQAVDPTPASLSQRPSPRRRRLDANSHE